MRIFYALVALFSLIIGGLDAFQATTGRRISKRPSTRDDATMRRQSLIAACVLIPAGLLMLLLAAAA